MTTLGFVRNNPWVQQDRLRRQQLGIDHNSNTTTSNDLYSPVFNEPIIYEKRSKSSSIESDEAVSTSSSGFDSGTATTESTRSSPTEISFGPGMVRKLRERFLQLAGTKNSAPSSAIRKKRFASMDDILENEISLPVVPVPCPISKQYSKSVSSLSEVKSPSPVIESREPVGEKLKKPNNLVPPVPTSEPEFMSISKRLRHVISPISPPDPPMTNGQSYIKHDLIVPENDQSPPPDEPMPPVSNCFNRRDSEVSELSSDDEVSYDVEKSEKYGKVEKDELKQGDEVVDGAAISEVHQLLAKFGKMRNDREQEEVDHPEPPKRRTLSSKFLQEKQQIKPDEPEAIETSPDPIFENGSNRSSESTLPGDSIDILEYSEMPETERRGSLDVDNFEMDARMTSRSQIIATAEEVSADDDFEMGPMLIAGDGNPIRHTLLSLVAEEDVPELLEAMQEEYHFEFEGETCVVVGGGNMSMEKKSEKGMVIFHSDPPRAYAYPELDSGDETASPTALWEMGVELTNDQYGEITTEIRRDFMAKRLEEDDFLAEFQPVNSQVGQPVMNGGNGLLNFVPSHLTAEEQQLGVTNSWSYEEKTSKITVNSKEQNDQLDVRPENSETSTFSKVENKSDLLF